MNRQLNCMISRSDDSPQLLAEELVLHGFIHYMDSCAIQVEYSSILPLRTPVVFEKLYCDSLNFSIIQNFVSSNFGSNIQYFTYLEMAINEVKINLQGRINFGL